MGDYLRSDDGYFVALLRHIVGVFDFDFLIFGIVDEFNVGVFMISQFTSTWVGGVFLS